MDSNPPKPPDDEKESVYSFEYSDGGNFEELVQPRDSVPVDSFLSSTRIPVSSSAAASSVAQDPPPSDPPSSSTLSSTRPSFSLGTLSPRHSTSSTQDHTYVLTTATDSRRPVSSPLNSTISSSTWTCGICTYSENTIDNVVCVICGISSNVSLDTINKDWICSVCTFENAASRTKCKMCRTRKDTNRNQNEARRSKTDAATDGRDSCAKERSMYATVTNLSLPLSSSTSSLPNSSSLPRSSTTTVSSSVPNHGNELYAEWINGIVQQSTRTLPVSSASFPPLSSSSSASSSNTFSSYKCSLCSTTVRNERFLRAHIWKNHQTNNPLPVGNQDNDNASIRSSSLSSSRSSVSDNSITISRPTNSNPKRKRLRKVADNTFLPPLSSTVTQTKKPRKTKQRRNRYSSDDSVSSVSSFTATDSSMDDDTTEVSDSNESSSLNTSPRHHPPKHSRYDRANSSDSDYSYGSDAHRKHSSKRTKRSHRPSSSYSLPSSSSKPTLLSAGDIQRIRTARLDQLLAQTTTIMDKLNALVQHQQTQAKLERGRELQRAKEEEEPSLLTTEEKDTSVSILPSETLHSSNTNENSSFTNNIDLSASNLSSDTPVLMEDASSSSKPSLSSSSSSLSSSLSTLHRLSSTTSFSILPSLSPSHASSQQGLSSIRPSHLSTLSVSTNENTISSSSSSSSLLPNQPSLLTHVTMRDYQIEGLRWLVSLHDHDLNGILADEMGLGKTLQILAFITYLAEYRSLYGPYLIVVPLSILGNWKMDAQKFSPDLATRIHLHHGLPDERFHALNSFFYQLRNRNKVRTPRSSSTGTASNPAHALPSLSTDPRLGDTAIVVTTYDLALRDRTILKRTKWQYLIVDEGHRLKNAQSKLSITLQSLRIPRRLLLTGTPLQNNLHELWALLNFCLPNLFNSSDNFSEWFAAPFENTLVYTTTSSSSASTPETVTVASSALALSTEEEAVIISRLHDVLRPFLLRRMKSDVLSLTDLPVKKETIIWCPMSAFQSALYERTRLGLRELIDPSTGKVTKHLSLNNLFMRLRQICNHPYLLQDTYYSDYDLLRSCGKFQLLANLLPKLCVSKHRILIFSQMTSVLDLLEDLLDLLSLPFLRLDGGTNTTEREERMRLFNAPDSPYQIFILSTRAGGLGINLATADTVIIYDSDWNPQADLQAQARAHRLGQTKEVHVYRLISRGPPVETVSSVPTPSTDRTTTKKKHKELSTLRQSPSTQRVTYRRSVEEIINLRAANKLRTEATVIGAGNFHHQAKDRRNNSTGAEEETNGSSKNKETSNQFINETLLACLNDEADEFDDPEGMYPLGAEDEEDIDHATDRTDNGNRIEPNNEDTSTVTSHTENGSDYTHTTASTTNNASVYGERKGQKKKKEEKYSPKSVERKDERKKDTFTDASSLTRYVAASDNYVNRLCGRDNTDKQIFHRWDTYRSSLVPLSSASMDRNSDDGKSIVDRLYYISFDDYAAFKETNKRILNDVYGAMDKVSEAEDEGLSTSVPVSPKASRTSYTDATSTSPTSYPSPSSAFSSLLSLSSPNKQSLPTRHQLHSSRTISPLLSLSYHASSSSSVTTSIGTSSTLPQRKNVIERNKGIDKTPVDTLSFMTILSPSKTPSQTPLSSIPSSSTVITPVPTCSSSSSDADSSSVSLSRDKLYYLRHYRLMQPEELSEELRQYCILLSQPKNDLVSSTSSAVSSSPRDNSGTTTNSSMKGKDTKKPTNSPSRSSSSLTRDTANETNERQRRQSVPKGSLNEASLYRAALATSRSVV